MSTGDAATVNVHTKYTSASDGGWGWIVLIGSFVAFFIADGWSYSFGVLFPLIVEHYDVSRGTAAIVGALVYAIPMILSPLACALITTYGCRPVAVFGGVLTGASLVAARVVTSFTGLCIIFGIFSSIGLALVFVSSLFIVSIYFDRRRGLATGLAVTGSACGAIVFPPLIEWLNHLYAWQGTLLVAGGICLHIIPVGMLFRPLSILKPSDVGSETRSSMSCWKRLAGELKEVIVSMCSRMFLTSWLFVIFCVSNFVLYLFVSMPYVYTFDLALMIDGISEKKAAFLLSLAGVGRIVGQIVFGMIGDIERVSAVGVYGFGAAAAGLGTMVVPVIAATYPTLAVYMTIFGMGASVGYVLPVMCLVEMIGFDNSMNAFGILQMIEGVATLVGTPIPGWLYDVYQSYGISFYLGGALLTLSGLVIMLLAVKVCRTLH